MSNDSKLDLFRREVDIHIDRLKQIVGAMRAKSFTPADRERAIQSAHILWGTARLIELESAANLAQSMRDCLIRLRDGSSDWQDDQYDVLLHATDLLFSMSREADGNFEQWMADRSWDVSTTQRTIDTLGPLAGQAVDVTDPKFASIFGTENVQSETPIEGLGDAQIDPELAPKTIAISPNLAAILHGDDGSMIDLFRLELETQVATLNEGLLALESQAHSELALETLMRAAHSIKGSARIVGLDAVVQLAHVMEDCFVAAQKQAVVLDPDRVDVLLQGVDWLQGVGQVDNATLPSWLATHQTDLAAVRSQISAILDPEGAQGPDSPELTLVQPSGRAVGAVETGAGAALGDRSTMATVLPQAPAKADPKADSKADLAEPMGAEQAIQDRVVRVSAENLNRIMGLAGESLIEANWLQPHADSMTVLKRRLVDLSRKLEQLQEAIDGDASEPVAREMLEQARHHGQDCLVFLSDRLGELELYAQRTANLSDRLYREVIDSHMRPFADGVQGFPRMVRDLARKLNKQIRLEILGKSTSVDRDILKKLEAPLTHILRNAVDHGIEAPEDRIAAGKSPEGTIRLEAFHRGGMLAITIADDGRGIDLNWLRQKVIKQQLVTPDLALPMKDAELLEYIFLPGFSTAKQVTEISGRGVGLDIAKSMAQEVGGTVRVTSHGGSGTSFHFQLPLTLSVVRTLLVEISGNPYAIPLARIARVLTISRSDIADIENRQYVTVDRQNIGLISAYQVLELPKPTMHSESLSIVAIGDRSNTYGLVVDRFLGERDLVVRPLDPRLGKIPDISAISLQGDGTPVLIIDVSDLVRSMDALLDRDKVDRVDLDSITQTREKRKRVLVVDDSITVREMERRLLENRGYHVDVAVNGAEGWNAVRAQFYDLIISDIDMPKMNGIELVRQVKQHPRLRTIPVIIVSYRDREEDRIQGLEAGADYYLTKSSFHDETFVDAVVDLIGKARENRDR